MRLFSHQARSCDIFTKREHATTRKVARCHIWAVWAHLARGSGPKAKKSLHSEVTASQSMRETYRSAAALAEQALMGKKKKRRIGIGSGMEPGSRIAVGETGCDPRPGAWGFRYRSRDSARSASTVPQAHSTAASMGSVIIIMTRLR